MKKAISVALVCAFLGAAAPGIGQGWDEAPDDAWQSLLAGDSLGASDDTEGAVQRAAWTVVANVLLNLDGALTKG